MRLAHRIMMTSLTTNYAEDHVLSNRHIAYYRERARGGVALIVTEQQGAARGMKGSVARGCSAWDERAVPQYARLAAAVHEYDTKVFVQLGAWGVHDRGTLVMDEWRPLWGASRVPSVLHHEIPAVMEQGQIDEIVADFARSAGHVREAGLDGIEIHAAHSYLLAQFLSPAYNTRVDRYGGSVPNRCRLVLEVLDAIRKVVGGDFPVGIRLCFDEFIGAAGITPAEAAEQVRLFAATRQLDYFSISAGSYHSFNRFPGTMAVPAGATLPFGRQAKAIVGDAARVFVVGPHLVDLQAADDAIASGAGDMIGMTRALLADPHLISKARAGRERDIVRCFASGECQGRLFDGLEVTCVANPTVGRERQWGHGSLTPVRASERKRIAVVGGGLAGMKTAATAAQRGHAVTLFERDGELGGHVNLLKRLPTRAEWQVGIDNLVREMESADVGIRLGTPVASDDLTPDDADIVVVATGADYDRSGISPYRPDRGAMPGADRDGVLDVAMATARALDAPAGLGRRVVILDETGEYLPLGLAEVLATRGGVAVEIVTPHLVVGMECHRTGEIGNVLPRLIAAGVALTSQTLVERIEGRTVELASIWGGPSRMVHDVDAVVLSAMRVPRDWLYHALRGRFDRVHRVGDALAPRRPMAIMYEAEELGRRL
jgi:2,4-dienoyl-CoA reductase-like NADH-dependent reductase (Old Yellow Enzyme family)